MKLAILRYFLILGITLSKAILFGSKLRLPLTWLGYYLQGSGRTRRVPVKILEEAASAIAATVNQEYWQWGETIMERSGEYCLYHSTLYEGSGFYGRPTMFYLVGGFSFVIPTWGDGRVCIKGVDRYDWHPAEWDNYYTSPLGKVCLSRVLVRALGRLFGKEYFTESGFPMCEAGISNRLWHHMERVGAKPFLSRIEGEIGIEDFDEGVFEL